jgi:hypothetical protein
MVNEILCMYWLMSNHVAVLVNESLVLVNE